MRYEPTYTYNIITENDYPQQIDKILSTIAQYSICGELESFDGLKLAYEYILVDKPIGNMIIVHGYTEFYKKYYEQAWYFMNMGYNVFLYDARGHGMSGRETTDLHFAHAYFFEDYAKDLHVIMKKLVNTHGQGLANYAFTHSMGGATMLLYLHQYPEDFKKVILSSPLIVPATHHIPLSAVQRLAIKGLRKDGPVSRFAYASDYNPNPPFAHANDRSEARFRYNMSIRNSDVHYQNSTSTNRWIYESTKLYRKLLNPLVNQRISTQILILSAGQDNVVRVKHHAILARQLPHAKLVRFRHASHSIYSGNDKQLAQYYRWIFHFLQS